MKKITFLTLLLNAFVLFGALPEELVVSSAPGGLFLAGEDICFKNTMNSDFAYEVVRFPEQSKCADGVIKAGENTVLSRLPRGYYALRKKDDANFAVRFAVVSDPAVNPRNPESFFALDAALSSLVPLEDTEKAVEIARRSGTRFIRERGPRFGRVEKERDVIDYSYPLYIEKLFAQAGIKVLSMYHSAPAWSRKERPDNRMPDDLFALYNFSRRTAQKVKAYCPAFEFWNEMDYKGPDSAWDYASALKAASLGYKAGFPEAQVMNGGFAINAGRQKYHHILMQNSMAEYIDILSLHCYGGVSQYCGIMKNNFKFLDKYNANHLKIWYTETGCRAEGKGKRGYRNSKIKKEHTFEQELVVSEFLVKQMTTAQFYGVDRNFYFSIYPCNEERGAKVWGLTHNGSLQVKAGLAAFSTLINNLSYARMLGAACLPENMRGFVYAQPNGTYTLLVWSISQNDTRLHEENIASDFAAKNSFKLPAGALRAENIFGTPIDIRNGSVGVGALPVYITLEKSFACKTVENRKAAERPRQKIDKTIVYQMIFSPEISVARENGPWKSTPSQVAKFNAESARVKLAVYNFSDQIKTGSVAISGCRSYGIDQKPFSIEPMSKKVFIVHLAPDSKKGTVEVNGTFNGMKTGKLSFPFKSEKCGGKLDFIQLPDDAGSWKMMSSGNGYIASKESLWSLDIKCQFSGKSKDKWCYPYCQVKNMPQKGKIAFEIAIDTPVEELKSMFVLLHHANGKYRDLGFKSVKPAGEFQAVELPYSQLTGGGGIKRIAIGVNTRGEKVSYRLRNIRVIPQK